MAQQQPPYFRNHQQQQQILHMSIYNEGSTLNSSFSSHNKTFGSCVDSSNFLSMSPIIFSENDIQEDSNINVSTWSMNQQQQKFMPRRQAPKEEDLPENLKFIEDLLQENDERRPGGNYNPEQCYMNQRRFPSFYTNMS